MKEKIVKSTKLKEVEPVSPVAPYIGGKRNLARTIIDQINTIPHTTYCEAFVGMGGVFFRRDRRPKAEVINDFNGEVANLFRVLEHHYLPFVEMIRWKLATRADFDRLTEMKPATLTDLQRAARFLYLQRLAFGGKVKGQTFGVTVQRTDRFNVTKLIPMLEDVHERLAGVVIECLDYKAFITRYDRTGTLFYLDPPYYGNEEDYGQGMFGRDEFTDMATLLKGIQGTFILSLNDRPEVRKIFKGFHIYSVETTYTLAGATHAKRVGEVLISNRKLKGL